MEDDERATIPTTTSPDDDGTMNDDTTQEEQAATIREDTKLAFGETLLTLWKIAFKGDQVSAVLGLPVHESDKQRHIHQVSGANPTHQTSQPNQQNAPDMQDWASSMTKVAEAWQQDIARKTKKDENSKDKNKKVWEGLPEIQKETILVAATQDDLVKPTTPTEAMLMVLGNAIRVAAATTPTCRETKRPRGKHSWSTAETNSTTTKQGSTGIIALDSTRIIPPTTHLKFLMQTIPRATPHNKHAK